ncbi:hypothetical protein [Actibacterium ureilyticum]|uniref:hypothetical protein n=1 Tax=Actibacterium ureilyticum TaxID=1590614 RepID=UPI001140A087|nr:hypothetical protein [Actibacterium ureilyticum]
MPDPMKNTDIEDVLSSIRRLVSYEPSNLRPAAAAKPAPRPERLVLTPALRVHEEPERPAPVAVAEEAPAQPEFVHRAEAPEAVVSDPAQQTLEDRIADLEVAVSQAGEEWEPDGSEAEANVYPTSYPVIEPLRPRMHLAEPEAAPTVEDHIEEVALDAGVDALMDAADAVAEKTALAIPAGGTDQAELRDLVRQIIREEFQGALGERITRNVRKLVRREINRALVSKEFE